MYTAVSTTRGRGYQRLNEGVGTLLGEANSVKILQYVIGALQIPFVFFMSASRRPLPLLLTLRLAAPFLMCRLCRLLLHLPRIYMACGHRHALRALRALLTSPLFLRSAMSLFLRRRRRGDPLMHRRGKDESGCECVSKSSLGRPFKPPGSVQ